MTLTFNNIDARDLVLEVEQTSHFFPFGQAVQSKAIADCHDQGVDNNYCQYVSQNFNWIVDTYRQIPDTYPTQHFLGCSRMKWRPIEPVRGDFEVETPTKMISWAQQNNISVRGLYFERF